MRKSVALFLLLAVSNGRAAEAMIFFNGGMGSAAGLTVSQINGVRASGMTTIVIFNMGVDAAGNLGGGAVCSNGVYTGPSNWGALLAQCKAAPSSVTRIEMCIGGWTDPSWTNIKNYLAANGTNSSTVLYRNLFALKNALGIDAIDNDDEAAYDSASAIQFGFMCASVGLKSTLCPYTNPSYWQAVKAGLGSYCDKVYLQCYDGGAYNTNGNNIANWNSYFGGLQVSAGYWDWERDTTFVRVMQKAKSQGAAGGFLWPSCTGCSPPADGNEMSQYGQWIQNTFNSVSQPVTAVETIGGQLTFTASSFVGSGFGYQWQVVRLGVTNKIPGATNLTLTLTNLQLTNTGSYFVLATNASGTNYSSASSLTVNTVPAPVNNVVTRYAAQTGLGYGFPLTPTWTFAQINLMLGRAPTATNGNYNLEPQWGTRSINELTAGDSLMVDGGGNPLTTSSNYVTCGNDGVSGAVVIYTLTNTSAGGYNLTNITVYGGWRDAGRDQQAFTVYYSKVSAPSTFILLASVNFNPPNPSNTLSATRSVLTSAIGYLATNVASLKFDFTSPASENGYCGYSEITASGVSVSPTILVDTLPATAVDVVGSSVTFTVGASGSALSYQWQKLSGGVTNNIADATNSVLTLTNLQLSDSASYQMLASNAYGLAVSSPRPLTVNSVPSPVNNVVTAYAAQTGLGGSANDFYTTWTLASGSLIAGLTPSSVGSGNFSDPFANECGTVAVLTDGSFGYLHSIPGNGGSPMEVACGTVAGGAGQSVTYTLPASMYAYNLTNITAYGGWGDAGRDQQAYTIYYANATAPETFIMLSSVNYNPSNPSGAQSATRVTLTPASACLATNVVAVKFDFTNPAPENGYTGYSEIQVFGVPNIPPAVPTSVGAGMVTGNLVLSISGMVIGRTYEVQSTTNLLSRTWSLETNFVAATTSAALTNAVSGQGQKFYRMAGY